MAIERLTGKQIATMSLEEKDTWWLQNVYKGDMPQLTVRSAITGMSLGLILSLTNLYVGMMTGWTLGVGITSVILSFSFFRVFSKLNLGSEITLLEKGETVESANVADRSPGLINFCLHAGHRAHHTHVPDRNLVDRARCPGRARRVSLKEAFHQR